MTTAPLIGNPVQHDAGFAGFRGLTLLRGEGSFVTDSCGKRFFDGTSMYGVASLGHGHAGLAAALSTQAQTLISCFGSFANNRRTELQLRLTNLLSPLDRIFLCNSGTEAVEAAIKMARATTGRSQTVALTGAFHGRTLGALSATFRGLHRDAFGPLVTGFTHVRPGDLEALDAALSDQVALFLFEPVQGEGGVKIIDSNYLLEAQRICRERGILFVADEVQTGIGRTGLMFGYQHADLEPDVVCLAKGLGGGVPIGAVAFRGEQVNLNGGSHGSTFGGNPLSCAAALAVLETLEREGLVAHVAELGDRLLRRFERSLRDCKEVRAVRGIGFMIGIELSVASAPLQRALQERGFLTLGAGPRVLRLLPPLNSTWPELEDLAEAICQELLQ